MVFNNFFDNPDDDIRDIYNDSSGTNNSNSLTAVNMKHMMHRGKGLDDAQSVEDHFKNFSFYDSP